MIDKNEYLKTIQDQVTAREKEIEIGLNRLRSAQNLTEYRAALQAVPSMKDVEDIEKGMQLLRNKQEDTEVRLLILQKGLSALGKNTEYIRDCFLIAQDATDDIEVRRAILGVLKVFNFGSRQFVPLRPEYMTLLRSLLDDPDALIRAIAAEELAKEKDEYVQRRLMDGLRDRELPIVPTAKAIQLLGYDIHAEHYPIVRNILADPLSDETTKVEAIHVLGNDPESKELLARLMTDRQQATEVRMSSAIALKTANFEEFISIAKPLILDDNEDEDLRVVSLNALMLHQDLSSLYDDEEFVNKVANLESATTSPDLKKLRTRLLDHATRNTKKQ